MLKAKLAWCLLVFDCYLLCCALVTKVYHVMLKAKTAWCLLVFDCHLLCCALVTKVFVKHILAVDYVDSYRGSEILSPGSGTALNKNNMSSDQEVAQPKPNPVLKTRTCNY